MNYWTTDRLRSEAAMDGFSNIKSRLLRNAADHIDELTEQIDVLTAEIDEVIPPAGPSLRDMQAWLAADPDRHRVERDCLSGWDGNCVWPQSLRWHKAAGGDPDVPHPGFRLVTVEPPRTPATELQKLLDHLADDDINPYTAALVANYQAALDDEAAQ